VKSWKWRPADSRARCKQTKHTTSRRSSNAATANLINNRDLLRCQSKKLIPSCNHRAKTTILNYLPLCRIQPHRRPPTCYLILRPISKPTFRATDGFNSLSLTLVSFPPLLCIQTTPTAHGLLLDTRQPLQARFDTPRQPRQTPPTPRTAHYPPTARMDSSDHWQLIGEA
jgi:hypothetical protein